MLRSTILFKALLLFKICWGRIQPGWHSTMSQDMLPLFTDSCQAEVFLFPTQRRVPICKMRSMDIGI